MRKRIDSLFQSVKNTVKAKLAGQSLNSDFSKKTSREKVLIVVLICIVCIALIFTVGIKPKMTKMKQAQTGLERAKSGYNYILQNASKVNSNKLATPDLKRGVADCVATTANDNKLKKVSVKVDPKDKNKVKVQTDEAVSYVSVVNFITELENRFGITVDEITLDKQGDGIVYISNLVLIRLEKGK